MLLAYVDAPRRILKHVQQVAACLAASSSSSSSSGAAAADERLLLAATVADAAHTGAAIRHVERDRRRLQRRRLGRSSLAALLLLLMLIVNDWFSLWGASGGGLNGRLSVGFVETRHSCAAALGIGVETRRLAPLLATAAAAAAAAPASASVGQIGVVEADDNSLEKESREAASLFGLLRLHLRLEVVHVLGECEVLLVAWWVGSCGGGGEARVGAQEEGEKYERHESELAHIDELHGVVGARLRQRVPHQHAHVVVDIGAAVGEVHAQLGVTRHLGRQRRAHVHHKHEPQEQRAIAAAAAAAAIRTTTTTTTTKRRRCHRRSWRRRLVVARVCRRGGRRLVDKRVIDRARVGRDRCNRSRWLSGLCGRRCRWHRAACDQCDEQEEEEDERARHDQAVDEIAAVDVRQYGRIVGQVVRWRAEANANANAIGILFQLEHVEEWPRARQTHAPDGEHEHAHRRQLEQAHHERAQLVAKCRRLFTKN